MGTSSDSVIYYLEGMAMNGLIRSFSKRNCDKGLAEVMAETYDGKKIYTGCIDGEVASRIIMVLSLYSKWGKNINRSI